jgi:hypothetical protein
LRPSFSGSLRIRRAFVAFVGEDVGEDVTGRLGEPDGAIVGAAVGLSVAVGAIVLSHASSALVTMTVAPG